MIFFIKRCDVFITWLANCLIGTTMALITVMVFFQVLARYFFKVSLGGFEELPVYLMIFAVWSAAAINSKEKGHIALDLVGLFIKSQRVCKGIDAVVHYLTAVTLTLFFVIEFKFLLYNFALRNSTPGLHIPITVLVIILLVSIALMIVYTLANAIKGTREVIIWQ